MNFIFTLDDPSSFTFNNNVYDKIINSKNKIFDYDNPRFEKLKLVLEKLLSLTDEFKKVHEEDNLMKCEIVHAKIMYDTMVPTLKLIESEIKNTKDEFKSILDELMKKIKSCFSNRVDSECVSTQSVCDEDKATILSYFNTIDSYFPELEKTLNFLNFTIKKHEIKRWLASRNNYLDETFRDECLNFWLTIQRFEGIWINLCNFCTAIIHFGELITVHYKPSN